MEQAGYSGERYDPTAHLLGGMAFLAESPEAYGFLPYAHPAVTSEFMVATNGQQAAGKVTIPTFPVEVGGVDGLLDTLYGGLVSRSADNIALLKATFGECEGVQEHPIARYCAALAEITALQLLHGEAREASFEQTCRLLGREISKGLSRLRDILGRDGSAEGDSIYYTVSLGACRVASVGEGGYVLDIFSAGDFRVFLLDRDGLSPLWLTDTPVLSPDAEIIPTGRSLRLYHPEPFAILLLSDSVCALPAAEMRALRENSGLVWRYRMRLEDQLLRLITSCVREQEFGERAAHFFTGHSRGRDSASGGMMLLRGEASYEVFRSLCDDRLSGLESMISLFPEGYDPNRPPVLLSREDMEREYIRQLLTKEPGLLDRVSEGIRQGALQKLRQGQEGDVPPPPDVPAYHRLSYGEVWETFRRYDRENDVDRERVRENRRILRDHLTDHWIALRPCLRGLSDAPVSEVAQRSYAACVELKRTLGGMLAYRQGVMARLEGLLSDSLEILRAEGVDWVEGRAGDGCLATWARGLTESLPPTVTPLLEGWQEQTEAYRSLLSAYTHERELLFCLDAEEGFFASDWQGIYEGTLSDHRWEQLCGAMKPDMPYGDMMKALCRLSKGTGELLSRMEGRGAERRMARELADRDELQIAALRASVYEDMDWGESVVAVLEPSQRKSYREAVRRWQESCELAARRAEVFEGYVRMYGTYLTGEQ